MIHPTTASFQAYQALISACPQPTKVLEPEPRFSKCFAELTGPTSRNFTTSMRRHWQSTTLTAPCQRLNYTTHSRLPASGRPAPSLTPAPSSHHSQALASRSGSLMAPFSSRGLRGIRRTTSPSAFCRQYSSKCQRAPGPSTS